MAPAKPQPRGSSRPPFQWRSLTSVRHAAPAKKSETTAVDLRATRMAKRAPRPRHYVQARTQGSCAKPYTCAFFTNWPTTTMCGWRERGGVVNRQGSGARPTMTLPHTKQTMLHTTSPASSTRFHATPSPGRPRTEKGTSHWMPKRPGGPKAATTLRRHPKSYGFRQPEADMRMRELCKNFPPEVNEQNGRVRPTHTLRG